MVPESRGTKGHQVSVKGECSALAIVTPSLVSVVNTLVALCCTTLQGYIWAKLMELWSAAVALVGIKLFC